MSKQQSGGSRKKKGLSPQPAPPEDIANGGPDVSPEGEQLSRIELDDAEAQRMLKELIDLGVVSWRHIAEKVLQSLQPPQSATHITKLPGMLRRYEKSRRWAPTRAWLYAQYGSCPCRAILNMAHDHVLPRDLLHEQADVLENLRFLCYRCNQSRHWEHGGKLTLGTAAAYVYLLLKHKPRTWRDLDALGRRHGLTQSGQRPEETWALAVHLYREGKFEIDEIHQTITKEQLQRLQAYYRETNDFFDAYTNELKKRFADRLPRWEKLQLLISARQARPADLIRAATELGIIDVEGMRKSIEETSRQSEQFRRRLVLKAIGGLSQDEINQIVEEKKVSLFHLLNAKERKSVLQEIDAKLRDLKQKHGVDDAGAKSLESSS